jgi:bacillithiol system protein YtxJ
MMDIQKIDTLPALDDLLAKSKETPVWVFKHSLTCPISGAAWSEFRQFAANASRQAGAIYALIEIQRARPVSTALAERTGVPHESPQAILLRNAQVAWHASHYEINLTALERA